LIFSFVLRLDNGVIWQNLYNGHHIFVPYLIFAAVIWKLVSNKPYGLLMFMAFIVPILWGFFFTLWYVLVTYIQHGSIETWFVLSIMVFWATFVGFLFELIPLYVLSKLKTKFKAVEQQNEALSVH
ncbi:MAG: hypothetical protein H6Q92_1959, partial [Nitrospirae bacterium]|nr:hypothetical protein [Nitrospirota bacterium]